MHIYLLLQPAPHDDFRVLPPGCCRRLDALGLATLAAGSWLDGGGGSGWTADLGVHGVSSVASDRAVEGGQAIVVTGNRQRY